MHRLFDNNFGYLMTYPCSQHNVKFQVIDKNLICTSFYNEHFDIPHPDRFIRLISKKDIFNSSIKIARDIIKEIKNIKYLGYSKDTNTLFNFSYEELLSSELIKVRIAEFAGEYGMPESNNGLRMNLEHLPTDENDSYNGIYDTESNPFDFNHYKIINPIETMLINRLKITEKTSIETYLNVMPFVNICLMIYYIKKISNGLKQIDSPTIVNLSEVFTELKTKYGIYDNKTSYNGKKRKDIIKFINKLQFELSCYINNNYKYTNYERNIYPNLSIDEIDESDYYKPKDIEKYFIIKKLIIVEPILVAYDYLLQRLTAKNTLEKHCNNCGETLLFGNYLCYECKLLYYQQVIDKYKKNKDKNRKIIEDLENEMNKYIDVCEMNYYYNGEPLIIDKIYSERTKSNKSYRNKKGDN